MADAKQFDEYRQKLTGLTAKAEQYVTELAQDEDFKNYVGRAPEEIRYSLSILKNNVFPIALFAKIQSGKSTTTAAMADGREITPCAKGGGGLRTSTVSVTIYNDDNVQDVEVNGVRTTPVKIKLYSKQGLVQCIIDAAGGHLKDTDPNSYDLDKQADKSALMAAIESEIELYQQAPGNYPTSNLATLREAILILAFYGCDAHQKLLAGEFSTIAGMQAFLKADGWETKWSKLLKNGFDKTVSQFSAEESLHVFVNSIMVPVKSDFMKKTGTAVTDAPGTMANLRDTMRALDAAQASAIIVFVLNGERTFTDEERNQLKTLRKAGLSDKVVFVLNFKDRTPQNIRKVGIEKDICDVLIQEGYTAPHHKNFLYYNAYLAMHAFQGNMIARGTLDDLSKRGLLEDAEQRQEENQTDSDAGNISVEDAWRDTTKQVLLGINNLNLALKVQEATLIPGNEIFQEIRAVSRWDEMIFGLRSHILNNRAAGVLLDLGARPVRKALENVEKTLQQREDAADRDLATIKAQYEQAKKILEEFSAQVEKILTENFTDRIDEVLARDYYDTVFLGSVEEVADVAAPQIFDSTGLMDNIKSMVKQLLIQRMPFGEIIANFFDISPQNEIQERCNNILSNCYKLIAGTKAKKWSETLEASDTYRDFVRKNVLITQEKLQQIWQDLSSSENNDFLPGINPLPPDLTGSMGNDLRIVRFQFSGDTAVQAQFNFMNVITSLAAGGGTFIGGAFVYLHVLPATLIIPGIGHILLGLSILVALLVNTNNNANRKQKIDAIRQDIIRDMRNTLLNEEETTKKQIIQGDISEEELLDPNAAYNQFKGQKPFYPGLKIVRLFYVMLFRDTIKQQQAALEAKYAQAKAELELTQDERDRIKAKAKDLRENRVAPLREDVAEIEQEITKIFA